MKKMLEFLKKESSTICVIGGCVGCALTGYFSGKAALKIEKILKDEKPATKEELIKKISIASSPALISFIFTTALIVTGNSISKKQIQSYAASYVALDNLFKKYRENVENDPDIFKKTVNQIAKEEYSPKDVEDDNILCFLPGYPELFVTTKDELVKAENLFFKELLNCEVVPFQFYLDSLKLRKMPYGNDYGWNLLTCYDLRDGYNGGSGGDLIDVYYDDVETEDGLLVRHIGFTVLPTSNYKKYDVNDDFGETLPYNQDLKMKFEDEETIISKEIKEIVMVDELPPFSLEEETDIPKTKRGRKKNKSFNETKS